MPIARHSLAFVTAALPAILAAKLTLAAELQGYTVSLDGVASPEIASVMRQSSQLVTLAEAGALPPFALIMRAREDVPRLRTVLESFGYYQSNVGVTILGLAPDDPILAGRLDELPANSRPPIVISAMQGPLYHVGRVTLDGPLPVRHVDSFSVRSGDPAVAAQVLGAGARLEAALQEEGYALAMVSAPVAYADDAAHTLDLTYKVTPGPQLPLGEIRFSGLAGVNEAFARQALSIHTGEIYDPRRIEDARRALAGLGVFSGVSVRADAEPDAGGRLPLTFDVEERPRRAIAFTGSYSTDLGFTLSAGWTHRNLFGNAEQLHLVAAGSGLGNASAGLAYNLKAQYVEPFFFDADQVLDVSLTGVKQQLDTYDQTAQILAALVRRKFSPLWSGTAGISFSHNFIFQQGTSRLYELVALPVSATYDSTGLTDLLRDPVQGLRATLSFTPTQSFGDSTLTFAVAQASASGYFDLAGDGRSVLALRALVGSILGGSSLGLPPDQRLYAGGSATVRGYAYQSLGPQFPDGSPIGAKSVDAVTVELRQRFLDDWGAAVFVDAGQVGSGAPFTGKLYVGAGAGLRYYTAIGAIRVDVATPVTPLPGAGSFQLYIGLGQAF